jgi:hypothetical protein
MISPEEKIVGNDKAFRPGWPRAHYSFILYSSSARFSALTEHGGYLQAKAPASALKRAKNKEQKHPPIEPRA